MKRGRKISQRNFGKAERYLTEWRRDDIIERLRKREGPEGKGTWKGRRKQEDRKRTRGSGRTESLRNRSLKIKQYQKRMNTTQNSLEMWNSREGNSFEKR